MDLEKLQRGSGMHKCCVQLHKDIDLTLYNDIESSDVWVFTEQNQWIFGFCFHLLFGWSTEQRQEAIVWRYFCCSTNLFRRSSWPII